MVLLACGVAVVSHCTYIVRWQCCRKIVATYMLHIGQALRRHVTWESFPTCDAAKIDWVRNKWVFATPGTSGTMNRSKCAVGMQGKHIEAVVVTGDQVTAYAALASGTAVKRMRPVSKQENLGPKRIARCGWGGGTSPLEALSIQLRNQR